MDKRSDVESMSHVSVRTPKTHTSHSKASYKSSQSGATTQSTKEKLLEMQIEFEKEKQKRLLAEEDAEKPTKK